MDQCPECRGTQFVMVERDGVRAARPCSCLRGRRETLRKRSAGIPRRYEHCDFRSFEPMNESLRRAARFAARVVEDFPSGEQGLLLTGPCGVGKTHLGVAVLRDLVEQRGAWGVFAEATELLRRIQDTFDDASQTASAAVLDPIKECDVLLLDDVGTVRPTTWTQQVLGLILNERYNARRLTLMTSNLPLDGPAGAEDLGDRIGARLASRIAEMCWVVDIQGEDFRRQFKSAQFFG
jgi:DNA replication protein DnaC